MLFRSSFDDSFPSKFDATGLEAFGDPAIREALAAYVARRRQKSLDR